MPTKQDIFGVLYLIKRSGEFKHRSRLQKTILIGKLRETIKYPFSFNYVRHFFGPYSFELQNLISQFVKDGVLEEKIYGDSYSYKITDTGDSIISALRKDITLAEISKLDKLWEKECKGRSTSEIISNAKKLFGW